MCCSTDAKKILPQKYYMEHKVAADVNMQQYSIVRFCDWTDGKRCAKGLKPTQQRQPPVFKRHNDTINECWPDRERSRPSWCCLFQGLEAFEAQDVTTCAAKTSSAPIKSCKLACETSNKGSRLDSVSRARPDASDSHNCWRQSSRQRHRHSRQVSFQSENFAAICMIKLLIPPISCTLAINTIVRRFKAYINPYSPHFGQLSPFFRQIRWL